MTPKLTGTELEQMRDERDDAVSASMTYAGALRIVLDMAHRRAYQQIIRHATAVLGGIVDGDTGLYIARRLNARYGSSGACSEDVHQRCEVAQCACWCHLEAVR